jgi:hypothetical protein
MRRFMPGSRYAFCYPRAPSMFLSVSGGSSSDDGHVTGGGGGSEKVKFSTSKGQFRWVYAAQQPDEAPDTYSCPNGFFGNEIEGLSFGESTTVTITVPGSAPVPTDVVKCLNEECDRYAQSTINGRVITLTDGGAGDADRRVDGVIIDPVAPAVNAGGSGGQGVSGGVVAPEEPA